jgi:hypothetical protein
VLEVTAPNDVLGDRVRQRSSHGNDTSEAGLEVLKNQLAAAEPISDAEKAEAIVISYENTGKINTGELVARIRNQR